MKHLKTGLKIKKPPYTLFTVYVALFTYLKTILLKIMMYGWPPFLNGEYSVGKEFASRTESSLLKERPA